MVNPGTPSIASAIGVMLVALLTMAGVTLGPEQHQAIMDNMNAVVGGLVALISVVQLLYGVYAKLRGKKEDDE